jgi:predicted  nucleic acid-binding Zn-ribbon protein
MNADLQRLITLQRLDTQAHEAQRKIAEEPERLRAMDATLDAARQQVASAKDRLAQSQAARREVEKEVAVHQGRLSKYRDQLMAVKTNIEYQAMQKEIQFAASEVKALEDKILERMIEADDLTAAVKQAESELATTQKRTDADRRALSAELIELKGVLEHVSEERRAVVQALDPKVLAIFESVANRRHGVAVAEARDGICTICHVRLRPQVFNSVRRNDDIIQCDSCSRILYFAAPAADPATTPS